MREIRIVNEVDRPRRLRLALLVEVALAPPEDDLRHPAFHKLFVRARGAPEAHGVGVRSPPPESRGGSALPGRLPSHLLREHPVPARWETDRMRFVGRDGAPDRPREPSSILPGGLRDRHEPITPWIPVAGAVLDLELEPYQEVNLTLLLSVAETEDAGAPGGDGPDSFRHAGGGSGSRPAPGRKGELLAFDVSPGELRELGGAPGSPPPSPGRGPESPPPGDGGGSLHALPLAVGDLRRPSHPSPGFPGRGGIRASGHGPPGPGLLADPGGPGGRGRAGGGPGGIPGSGAEPDPHPSRADRGGGGVRGSRGGSISWRVGSSGTRIASAWRSWPPSTWILEVGGLEENLARLRSDGASGTSLHSHPTRRSPTERRRRGLPPLSSPTAGCRRRPTGASTRRPGSTSSTFPPGTRTPAPWVNVIAREEGGFLVTESGGGFTWSGDAGEFRLTPWSNDPVLDTPGRGDLPPGRGYGEGLDSGTPSPGGVGDTPHPSRVGVEPPGDGEERGSPRSWSGSSTPDLPVKVTRVRLRNDGEPGSPTHRHLLRGLGSGNPPHPHRPARILAGYREEWAAVVARNPFVPAFRGARWAFLASDRDSGRGGGGPGGVPGR
jgi:hypothetical protein